jgi:hypothetical protein
VTPYAKAAEVSPDGLCVEFLRGGALRRSVIERGASSCLDALPQLGAGVLPVYRTNDPRLLSSVNGGVADQASAAVLNVNCVDQIADTALVQAIDVGGIPINGRRKSSPTGPFVADFVEGVGIGISLAIFPRFWAVVARVNSSRAPFGPRKRGRSSLRMRLRFSNSIPIPLRSRRES